MAAVEQIARSLSGRTSLTAVLPDFLRQQRWFGGKAQPIRAVHLRDVICFDAAETSALVLLVGVEYLDGAPETYAVPVIAVDAISEVPHSDTGEAAPHLLIAAEGAHIVLYDAFRHPAFLGALLAAVRDGRRFRGEHGELRAEPTAALAQLAPDRIRGRLMRAEQSNTSVIYDDRLVLKLFRRIAEGVNPDVEIGRFLTEKTSFRHVPLLAGSIEYVSDAGTASSVGILQSFVRNQGDAWEFTLAAVGGYFESLVHAARPAPVVGSASIVQLAGGPLPPRATQLIGEYLPSAELLGRRTAELHLALSTHAGDPAFDPEPFAPADQRRLFAEILDLVHRNFALLRRYSPALDETIQRQAEDVLSSTPEIEERLREFERHPINALRTRIHGDYHLGQVLVIPCRSGREFERGEGDLDKSSFDFVILDFEGEPARTLEERRRKRSPLQDVAGMLRSFHYAAFAPLLGTGPDCLPLETYEPWAYAWQMWVSAAFLREYLSTAAAAAFLPRESEQIEALLNAHLIEKAVYELGYELNNRPTWVRVPLSGIAQLLGVPRPAYGARPRRIA